MEKSIGIGIEDFKKVINENCYYIDKTKWIEEIIKDKSEIKLLYMLYSYLQEPLH